MKSVCKIDMCAACMLCVDICRQNAITVEINIMSCNAFIDEIKCIKCNKCMKICPQNNILNKKSIPVGWYQGWASEEIRCKSTSGGFAAAIMMSFLKENAVVCTCGYVDGEYKYMFINKKDEIQKFIGSKYVKSNPQGIYKSIEELLQLGTKVLFIGLPCHVAALKNYINHNNLYLVELICHGTPSLQLLRQYFNEKKGIFTYRNIKFRNKKVEDFEKNNDIHYKHLSDIGEYDYYTLAFLFGLSFTDNCYECKYASIERISDLMLGDSWGSELSKAEQNKGISLAFYQNEKGKELLEKSDLHLFDVDLKKAKKFNHQLNEPANKSYRRNIFFSIINKHMKFRTAVWCALPGLCIKLSLRTFLSKMGLIKKRDSSYGIWIKEE